MAKIIGYSNSRGYVIDDSRAGKRLSNLRFTHTSRAKDTSYTTNQLSNFRSDTPAQAAKKSKQSSANFAVSVRRFRADFMTGFGAVIFFLFVLLLFVNTIRQASDLSPLTFTRFFSYMANPPFDISLGVINWAPDLPWWLDWLEPILQALWLSIRFVGDCIASTVSFLYSLILFFFGV